MYQKSVVRAKEAVLKEDLYQMRDAIDKHYADHGKYPGYLGELVEKIEQAKASIRAKVEHPFHVVKNLFRHRKTRYRGLAKNTQHLLTLFGLANLVLARASNRRSEFAVRISLGGGRARLMRQLLTENLILAGLGSIAGLVVADWTSAFLAGSGRVSYVPLAVDSRVDRHVAEGRPRDSHLDE